MKPIHMAVFYGYWELFNTKRWPQSIQTTSQVPMEKACIKQYNAYKNALADLQQWNVLSVVRVGAVWQIAFASKASDLVAPGQVNEQVATPLKKVVYKSRKNAGKLFTHPASHSLIIGKTDSLTSYATATSVTGQLLGTNSVPNSIPNSKVHSNETSKPRQLCNPMLGTSLDALLGANSSPIYIRNKDSKTKDVRQKEKESDGDDEPRGSVKVAGQRVMDEVNPEPPIAPAGLANGQPPISEPPSSAGFTFDYYQYHIEQARKNLLTEGFSWKKMLRLFPIITKEWYTDMVNDYMEEHLELAKANAIKEPGKKDFLSHCVSRMSVEIKTKGINSLYHPSKKRMEVPPGQPRPTMVVKVPETHTIDDIEDPYEKYKREQAELKAKANS
ncbi:MAG: hypothetical protein EOO39_00205 [Cytophagaceae bacterium]|nr:MAG: hypothetical protein EOO39_00205 [Cytophagaceae bacterium]